MSRRNGKPLGEDQAAGDNETSVHDVSAYKCTTKRVHCQVLALADLCLENYNRARAEFVATGSAEAFRAALAARQDRAALLREVGR